MKYLGTVTNDYDLVNKKYVDGKSFKVTVSYSNGDYTADKTYSQVAAVVGSGPNSYTGVYVYLYDNSNNFIAPLQKYDNQDTGAFIFSSVWHDSSSNSDRLKIYRLNDDDTVEVTNEAVSDTKVTQTNTTTSSEYRVLLAGSVNDTSDTTTTYKSTGLRWNPSTRVLNVSNTTVTGTIQMGLSTSDSLYTAINALGWTSDVIV